MVNFLTTCDKFIRSYNCFAPSRFSLKSQVDARRLNRTTLRQRKLRFPTRRLLMSSLDKSMKPLWEDYEIEIPWKTKLLFN
jgi:hypothetical protein